jgi:hypothetical protein
MRFNIRLVYVSLLLSLASCTPLILKTMGMKKPHIPTDEEFYHFGQKWNMSIYFQQTLLPSYIDELDKIDSVNPKLAKDLLQPIQAMYFDASGKLVSFHINCYAGGYLNLNWNKFGNFDLFPAKTNAPCESSVTLSWLLPYLKPVEFPCVKMKDLDYTVVVFWSRWTGRQSEHLVEYVQKNIKLAPKETRIQVMYVNTDEVFTKLF